MHVVRQDHPGVDAEGALHKGQPGGLPQHLDLAQQEVAAASGKGNGQEEGGTGAAGADVAGHGATVARSG